MFVKVEVSDLLNLKITDSFSIQVDQMGENRIEVVTQK
jgi:hypothetical protein